jgi:hypothetical protein
MVSLLTSTWPRVTLAAACLLALGAPVRAQTPTAHFSNSQRTLPSSFTYPYGVAVDSSGNIYIADNFGGVVSVVALSGDTYTQGAVLGGFNGPYGVAVDAHGNVYISETGYINQDEPNDVIKETVSSTPYGNSYAQSVVPTSGLNTPYGVAADSSGNVYIADGVNDRILKETPSGGSYSQSTVPSSALILPMGVAVDAGGNGYIADWGNHRVLKETPSGTSYAESTVAENTYPTPIAVSVDARGNVYILNYQDDQTFSVLKETLSNGVYIQSTVAFSPNQNPYGMAADASGNVYIASPGFNRLLKLVAGAGDFGPVNVGSTSLPVSLIFTFDTGGTLGHPAVPTQGVTGLDFTDAGSGSCGTQGSGFVYNAGDTCTIDVIFKPQFSGTRYGAAVLQDASVSVPEHPLHFGPGTSVTSPQQW